MTSQEWTRLALAACEGSVEGVWMEGGSVEMRDRNGNVWATLSPHQHYEFLNLVRAIRACVATES